MWFGPEVETQHTANESRLHRRLSEGAILALLPAYAYAIAYCYARGQLSHFGAPNYLVRLDLSAVVIAVIAVLIAMGAILAWVNLVSMSFPHAFNDTTLGRRIRQDSIVPIALVALAYFGRESSKDV